MQFEATTWDATRPGAASATLERSAVAVETDGVELIGSPAAVASLPWSEAHPHGSDVAALRAGRWHRRAHGLRLLLDAGHVLAVLPAAVDLVLLSTAVSLLRWWTPAGAAWLLLTFGLLRDTASAQPHRRINAGAMNDLAPVATRVSVALLGAMALARLTGAEFPVAGLVFLPVSLLAGRALAAAAVRGCRVHLGLLEPTVIVGTGENALHLAGALCEHPQYGSQPIGFLDSGEAPDELPLPWLGDPCNIESVVRSLDVRRVIVADGRARDDSLVDVIRGCTGLAAEIYVVPRFAELNVTPAAAGMEQVRGVPVMHLPRRAGRSASWQAKRLFDAVAATLLLLLLSPLLLAVAAGVRLGSPGPVLYRQRRVGMHGRTFELLKFRTMRLNQDGETTWSVRHDSRVTGLGRWLRRSGFDELPQLLNVLRGEMSLVGPRPERPYFVERFRTGIPGYDWRLRVPPGITGWAQVHGLRGDTSVAERAQFDNHYVENWSLWRDVAILLRTLLVGMKSGHD